MSGSRAATIYIPLLFFCCSALSAQPAAGGTALSTAPAAEQPAVRPSTRACKYSEDIMRAQDYLAALLRWSAEADPKALEETVKDVNGLSEKLKGLLGPETVRELEERDKDRRIAAAREALAAGREALQHYFADSEGKFPKLTEELSPRYLDMMPELGLPGHERTRAVLLIDSAKHDKDLSKAVGDGGGWLYFTDPKSAYWGMLMLDCSHKDAAGMELYKY